MAPLLCLAKTVGVHWEGERVGKASPVAQGAAPLALLLAGNENRCCPGQPCPSRARPWLPDPGRPATDLHLASSRFWFTVLLARELPTSSPACSKLPLPPAGLHRPIQGQAARTGPRISSGALALVIVPGRQAPSSQGMIKAKGTDVPMPRWLDWAKGPSTAGLNCVLPSWTHPQN